MTSERKKILITGGTGALGSPVVSALLAEYPHHELLLLTRNAGRYVQTPRLRYVQCDLLANEFELSVVDEDYRLVDKVLHIAADVRWNLDVSSALDINTRVTERLLELIKAKCPKLSLFLFVSTAYVDAPNHIDNNQFQVCAPEGVFNNTYEYSKFLSEESVKTSGLPWVIVRPSLILGDTDSGQISSFNGFYYMMRTIARGHLPFIVGDEKAFADIVPVDVACHVVLQSIADPRHLGKIVWAISGKEKPTIGDLVTTSTDVINNFRLKEGVNTIDRPSIIDSERYHRLFKPLIDDELSATQKRFVNFMDVFVPYFSMPDVLQPSKEDIVYKAVPFDTYLAKSMEYWCEQNLRIVLGRLYHWKLKKVSA